MFKRLKDRIVEEATKFPVGQNFGANPLRPTDSPARGSDNAEDLITLSDSSASVINPLPSSPQFSIAGEDDATFSDPNSPQKKSMNNSAGSELYSTPNTRSLLDGSTIQTPNMITPLYIPQTDIESEVEEPPTLNLDGISKEQLLATIEILKARLCKYKNKYAEVVKAYKGMNEDKKKLEHALTENQDKSLRRIAELREQCQLEQKAKAHLEENLRLILEEKDSRISVLETQINLLKEGQSSNTPSETETIEQNSISFTPEQASLHEKIQKLQSLLKDCKATILSKTEQITELSREKEMLSQKIVTQSRACEEFEEKEADIRIEYENILQRMKVRLTELEQQQEDSVMSMAETKKNMHEELELKERQLVKLKEETRVLQLSVEHEKSASAELKKLHDEKIRELLTRLETTEQVMEEGKHSLVKELSKAKAEAIALIQQESAKKIAATEEECSIKLKELEHALTESFEQKQEELVEKLSSNEEEVQGLNTELTYLRDQIEYLKEEKANLENHVKEVESGAVLKSENGKLSYQLDESLLVAAGNQSVSEKELSKLKELVQKFKEKLSEKDKEFIRREEKFNSSLSEKNTLIENYKQEKETLNEKLKSLQSELNHSKDLENQISSLQDENDQLKSELDSLAELKREKQELNSRISLLEHSKQDLEVNFEAQKAEINSLRTTENSLNEKLALIENERDSLTKKLKDIGNSKCQGCAALKCDLETVRHECEQKLLTKDDEAEEKLKLVIKEFYQQLNIKDYDCDLTVSEFLEQSKCIEGKLQKEHRIELAALRQDIFEKDCALEEMHEHYEGLMKEKDALIKEHEKNSKISHLASNSDAQTSEPSDWDDTWVVPEESCEAISPSHSNKADCDKYKKEVENLQEELEKCNTELKDLRILLRLTPPQSLCSNNNYSSMIPISEPTEFEYLKNILFEYMMGKETVTLVKVIAAVLRFSDEQTRLIVEREKAKNQAKK